MNSVDFLLTNKYITYEIRTEIKRLGRPIPDLIISKTDVGKSRNYSRNFNSSVYADLSVMGDNQSAWTQEGGCIQLKLPSKRQAVVDDDTKLNLLLVIEENPITPARQLMPRKRDRTTKKTSWTVDSLENAITTLRRGGISVYKVSQETDIPYSTLKKRQFSES
ncbi:hypothetical protein NQ318_007082 [Aromia moschata]|uniref:Resolvase HTH domain-containing protein n=1 Tax=Aromia moschata TaxID=1265417 RepID=A0AAV8XFA6_9CUCU|nr:hypothetical protein NQ318_007082 [Aromia moschata]